MFSFADTVEKNILTDLTGFAAAHPADAGSYFVSYETNSIRLTYSTDKGRWIASTRNRENAYHSRWAERKSFGTFFEEECEAVCGLRGSAFESKYLDKTKSYGFLVPLRGANKVLTRIEMPPTLFLAEVKSEEGEGEWTLFHQDADSAKYQGPWKFPTKIDPEKDREIFASDPYAVGIVFVGAPEKLSACPSGAEVPVVRFIYPEFLHARLLRDNTPSILLRYGKLWKERSSLKADYEDYYHHQIEPFERAVQELYEIYVRRYLKGETNQTTPIRHAVLKKMRSHQLYKGWDSVSENNIKDVIFKYFGDKIHKLL